MANTSSVSINKRADDQFKKLTRDRGRPQGPDRIRSPRRRDFNQDRAPQGAPAGARRDDNCRATGRAGEEGPQGSIGAGESCATRRQRSTFPRRALRPSFVHQVLPNLSNSPPGHEGRRSADRRNRPVAASSGCGSALAQRARLSALHRGSRLGDRTPPLSSGPRFTLWRIVTSAPTGGPWTLSTAELSQTPGRPVVMPAGTMPEAARERFAKPPAGAAPAPHSGLPSGKRPLRERGDW